jgi:hypothetical protein
LQVGFQDFLQAGIPADLFYLAVADLVLDIVGLEEGSGWGGSYFSHWASTLPFDGTPGSSRFFFLISVSVSSIYRLLPLLINKYKKRAGSTASTGAGLKMREEGAGGRGWGACCNRKRIFVFV